MRTIFVALVSLFAATLFADGPDCPVTYGYSGFAQPSQWEYLSKDTALCGKGKTQSPVRLANVHRTKGDVVHFDYHASKMTLRNSGHDFRALPEGENLVFVPGVGDAAGYRLDNFHFHTPNEHVVPNVQFDGEIHLVHKRGDQIVVVAIFVKAGGAENKTLKPVLDKLPLRLCAETPIEFDPNALLATAKGDYYHYTGSLTTPACTEGVRFYIYPRPIVISNAQLGKLATYGKNARPLQENEPPIPIEYVTTTKKTK